MEGRVKARAMPGGRLLGNMTIKQAVNKIWYAQRVHTIKHHRLRLVRKTNVRLYHEVIAVATSETRNSS